MLKKIIVFFVCISIITGLPLTGFAESKDIESIKIVETIEIVSNGEIYKGQAIEFSLKLKQALEATEIKLKYKSLEYEEDININLSEEESSGIWRGKYIVKETDKKGEWTLNKVNIMNNDQIIDLTSEQLDELKKESFVIKEEADFKKEQESSIVKISGDSNEEKNIKKENTDSSDITSMNENDKSKDEENKISNSLSVEKSKHSTASKIDSIRVKLDKLKGYSNEEVKISSEVNLVGNPEVEYKYYIGTNYGTKDVSWKVLKDYSSSKGVSWVPEEAGEYRITIHARRKGSNKTEVSSGYTYKVNNSEINSIKVVPDKSEGYIKERVNIFSNVELKGNPEIEYKYYIGTNYGTKDVSWKVLKDYSSSKGVSWVPEEAGEYRITIHARQKGGNKTEASSGYTYKTLGDISFFNNNYNISFEDFLAKQMNNNPQTDRYGSGWNIANVDDTANYLNPENFLQFSDKVYKYDVEKNNQIKIITNLLNVRKGNSISYDKVDEVRGGEVYDILSQTKGWYKIKTSKVIGWISSRYAYELYAPNEKSLSELPSANQICGSSGKVQSLSSIKITTEVLNVRSKPNSSGDILAKVNKDQIYIVLDKFNGWYKINSYGVKGWVYGEYVKITNEVPYDMYQFLDLSGNGGLSANQLNNVLKAENQNTIEKSILEGKGEAFIKASKLYNINEIYLISHAFLETGRGTSTLAKGVKINGKTVYNMYGIGAYDSNPIVGGSQYAYDQGWFTPEEAIIGGAKFISQKYVNNTKYKQNTLYKMRWNPENPTYHQYATDIGWAYKQMSNIKKLYDLCSGYRIKFEIPKYI